MLNDGSSQTNNAYLTFLSSDNYIYYILALYDSWKLTNSIYPLYCCITDDVGEATRAILTKIGLPYIVLESAQFDEVKAVMTERHMVKKYISALAKLSIFSLTQFDKCVYLDSDLIIRQNIDELFDRPAWTAVEDCLPVHKRPTNYVLGESSFCSGLFVFEPDYEFFCKIMEDLPNLPEGIKWHDQAILAYYHQDWMQQEQLHLPCEYDLLIAAQEDVLNTYLSLGGTESDIKVEHYVTHKDAPYFGKDYYFWDNVYDKYYAYYRYIDNLLLKYDLSLTRIHFCNIHKKSEQHKIDFVFPFVDCNDKVWQKTYNSYCWSHGINKPISLERFRSWDLLKYYFRGIEKFAPYIRNVYMIVSNIEQVPDWVDQTKVHIVLHKDIIPAEYLPTFSSPCIEMFIKNIPGLAEKFIYANDDMFIISKLAEQDLFDGFGKVKFKLLPYKIKENASQFARTVQREYNLVYGYPSDNLSYMQPSHGPNAMLKSLVDCTYSYYEKDIRASINAFRTLQDINQYVYCFEADKLNRRTDSYPKLCYIQSEDKLQELTDVISNKKATYLCINDQHWPNFEVDKLAIQKAFEKILPDRCKYEKIAPAKPILAKTTSNKDNKKTYNSCYDLCM